VRYKTFAKVKTPEDTILKAHEGILQSKTRRYWRTGYELQ